ncbi:hypothetical protein [Chamaesiphon minutus]|uniref:Uncharacterized protein n=1 Tax=Chamaesiphon minutus (strain ATCC 27169 / PCC 6605) TaxID=1173020 RepID=K9UC17_CHAP6|nr:hypothetical protein [Chamaesiphon minutus]AFY92657.1 hypothetical protein Cha6605_1492 [Chamaesiphon minutus PCC 6605]
MLTDSDLTSSDFTDVPTSDFHSGFTGVPATEVHPHRMSARELHRYVWGLMAVFGAFALSYPIACWRVSQSEQFRPYGSHVKDLTLPISGSTRK